MTVASVEKPERKPVDPRSRVAHDLDEDEDDLGVLVRRPPPQQQRPALVEPSPAPIPAPIERARPRTALIVGLVAGGVLLAAGAITAIALVATQSPLGSANDIYQIHNTLSVSPSLGMGGIRFQLGPGVGGSF